MEITSLKVLIESISCFLKLPSREQKKCEFIWIYYQKTKDILKLLKPILDAIINAGIASHDEKLQMPLAGIGQSVDELREIFENWQPLMSKVYLVLQVESLMTKVRASSLEIFHLLRSSEHFPSNIESLKLQHIMQKMEDIEMEETSMAITKAMRDQLEGSGVTSDSMAKITDCLSLKSNLELLIEVVALENMKNSELWERNGVVDHIDGMLALVIHMHQQHVMLKQSQADSPVTIPVDFCCPLSLKLMTDPVIIDSGQTYERAFIQEWIDLGLTVCPKTKKPLAHTGLIPNYIVKAWIGSWCESNNVKLPAPIKSTSFNHPSPLLGCLESCTPRDSQALTHSGGKHCTMQDSARNLGSPTATDGPWEEQQLSHVQTSEDFLPGVIEDGHQLDLENMSGRGSYDRVSSSGERKSDSSNHFPASPSRNDAAIACEHPLEGHKQTISASTTDSNSKVYQTTSSGGNETSDAVVVANDTSTEITSELETAATVILPGRKPELPSWLTPRTRNEQTWHKPSERFVPRIVQTSAVETSPDLSEVEVHVKNLVEDLKSPSLDAQRNATAELRALAKHNVDNRIVIASCGAIRLLVNLLRSRETEIQEYAVTALLNLSINDNNKTAIANADAIEPLVHVLQTGSPEAKENTAATLFSLSVVEDNKAKIGKSGAINALVDLLGNGTPRGKKDAATALFNLSLLHENKALVVQAGAVDHLLELLDPAAGMVDKAVAILSNLSTIHEGRQRIGQQGGIPLLVEVVELGSTRSKENAAATLLQLCTDSTKFCNMVCQEGAIPPLGLLLQSGTARAKDKAQKLLSLIRSQRQGTAGRG